VIVLDSNSINNLRPQKVRKLLNYVMGRDGDLPIRFNLDSSFRLSVANNFGYVDIYSGGLLAVSTTYGIFTVDELAYLNNNSLVIETHDKQRETLGNRYILPLLPTTQAGMPRHKLPGVMCVDPK
jgi:hypothetical protein